jgi:hypothetical protein
MTVQASVFQRSCLGNETVAGTSVPANKRMPSLLIAANPKPDIKSYRAQGIKVTGTTAMNKEWGVFKYDGAVTFEEVVYPYASLFGTEGMGPAGNMWTFEPYVDAPNTHQSYTIEHGSPDHTGKLVNGVFTNMTFSVTRDELKISGDGIGKLWTPGVTPTASPSMLDNTPCVANQVSLYLDSTASNLGHTKLTSAYTYDLTIGNILGPDWVLDAANTSWKDVVELVPAISLKMKLQNNSQSDSFIDQMRANSTSYLQFSIIGPVISGGVSYTMVINMPVRVKDGGEPSDLAGVYVCEWTLEPVMDSAFMAMTSNGKAYMQVYVQNQHAGL